MAAALLAVVAVFLWFIFRVLNIHSQYVLPKVLCKDSKLLGILEKLVPSLDAPYIPTRLWGFNGHIQTIIHSVVGRVMCPWPRGERRELVLGDGSTLTYDLYQPIVKEQTEDVTLAIVPGICNSSESVYVRTFVHYSQCHGFRCAVLNHIGALKSVPLTSPRVFTYGHTEDLTAMINHLIKRYPNTKMVCIGYSMGGNLVTKYLGESVISKPNNIIGGISVCQGYDILLRIYLYTITEEMKSLILRNRKILLSEPIKRRYGLIEKDIASAATLPELDDAYTKKVNSFNTVAEFYRWGSSINYIENIQVPMIFVNSLDDPLIPDVLLEPIKLHCTTKDKTAYIEVAHGGHLGFYEGGILYPSTVTWLDRTLIDTVSSIQEYNQTH